MHFFLCSFLFPPTPLLPQFSRKSRCQKHNHQQEKCKTDLSKTPNLQTHHTSLSSASADHMFSTLSWIPSKLTHTKHHNPLKSLESPKNPISNKTLNVMLSRLQCTLGILAPSSPFLLEHKYKSKKFKIAWSQQEHTSIAPPPLPPPQEHKLKIKNF